MHHKTQTLTRRQNKFVEHLHGSGAGSLRPQIYEATTELGDKNSFRNQPRATGSPAGDSARDIPQENSEKHPGNMFKVITYTRSKSHDAEFDGAGYQEVGLG